MIDARDVACTYTLKKPFEVNGKEYTELKFMAVKAAHFKKIEKRGGGPIEQACYMIELLTLEPSVVVDNLYQEDFTEVAKLVGNFFQAPSVTTGETAPQ